jgi:hypothetical protein
MENVVICGECIVVKKKPKKLCEHEGCNKQPNFNNPNETNGRFCFSHKEPEMVNVVSKKCEHENCNKQPNFNNPNETVGRFCNGHKELNMINVVSKRCEYENCNKIPIYNNPNETNGRFCAEHKQPEMVDVKSKRCEHKNCNKIPNFNNPDETIRRFCNEHKQPNMVNVKSKKCEHEGCNKQPCFNNPNETNGRFCAEHKQPEMVDVISKCCEYEGCNKRSYFNNSNETSGRFCKEHKEHDMVDVKHKRCIHEWCNTFVSNKNYEGFCMRCYIYKYHLKLVSRNYKTKEFTVVEFVKTNFPDYEWVADKIVQDGCSRRRPDLLLDFGDFILIIEVDENQHIDYDISCENKRTMEISRDLGHRNIVFIRFNPDDYMIGNEKITSCWGANKTGIFAVKKSKTKEWGED